MINNLIDISFYDNPPRRGGRGGGRGRGGRGGFGGRGKGRGGGGRRSDPAPNVQDDRDFPSLGSAS